MRDAKLEAMGMRPDDHEYRRQSDRAQMATDELVSLLPTVVVTPHLLTYNTGYGTVQEANAEVRWRSPVTYIHSCCTLHTFH